MACLLPANRSVCFSVEKGYENLAVNQKASIFVSYVIKEFAHTFSCAQQVVSRYSTQSVNEEY